MDAELGAVFKAESEDHLAALARGLLALEAGTAGPEGLDDLLRAAHRFKGAARVVGAEGVEAVAHRLEDLLEGRRTGRIIPSPGHYDLLSWLLDGLGELVDLALAGRDQQPRAAALLADPAPVPARAGALPAGAALPPALPPAPVPEVLRVPLPRLDELLNLAGELLASHQRLRVWAEAAGRHAERLGERLGSLPRAGPGSPAEARELALGLREEEARLESLLAALGETVRRTRLVPVARLWTQVAKWARDLARQTGKEVDLELEGGELEVDQRILDGLRDPLLHLLRNALDHGLEPAAERAAAGKPERGRIVVRALERGEWIHATMEDDGRGVDPEAVRRRLVETGWLEPAQAAGLDREALLAQLFRPGFSTRSEVGVLSGRGVGLDLVRAQMEALKGSAGLVSAPGAGTRVELRAPLSLATVRVLLVEAGGMTLGIPSAAVQGCLRVEPGAAFPVAGRATLLHAGTLVPRFSLAALLGLPARPEPPGPALAVVVRHRRRRAGFQVDALVGEQAVLQKPLGPRLRSLVQLSGAALLGDGRICLVLDPEDLLARTRAPAPPASPAEAPPARPRPRLLVADDSLSSRVQLRRALEAAGCAVTLALDGLDAWARLGAEPFDALVSDVDMPGLDGIALAGRVRAAPGLARLPVVLVTAQVRPELREAGLAAGADAVLAKDRFDQADLVAALGRLLGARP